MRPKPHDRSSGAAGFEAGLGLLVEFESFPDVELAFESLARERQGIELLNVRHDENRTLAAVALAGNLTEIIERSDPVEIDHRLESVKLLPKDGATGTDPRHHAYLTVEAVSRPEVTAPSRVRVFGMAVTARDNRDRGRPVCLVGGRRFVGSGC